MTDNTSHTEETPVSIAPWASPPEERSNSPLTKALQARRPTGAAPAKDPHFNPVVPIDHHPDALGDADTSLATYKTAHRGLANLWDVHTKLNETAMTVTDKAALAKQIEPITLRAIKGMKEDIAALDRQIAHADTELSKELGVGVGAIAAETRAVLRAMPKEDRIAFCRDLVAANDVASLKAIASVSPFLSGLDGDAYRYVRSETERMVAPKFVDERDTGIKARTRMQRALSYFDEQMAGNIKRWRSTDDQKLADLVSALKPKEIV